MVRAAGTWSYGGASSEDDCNGCEAGQFMDVTNECQQCTQGETSAANSTTCTSCPAGHYATIDGTICISCPGKSILGSTSASFDILQVAMIFCFVQKGSGAMLARLS